VVNEPVPSEPVLDGDVEIIAEPMGDGRTIRYYRWPSTDVDTPAETPPQPPEDRDV
jgi:hypothetical protein